MRTLKRRLLEILAVLAVAFALIELMHYGPPRFWRDFTGMTEAEVRAHLGDPFRDSRSGDGGNAKAYTLGWYQGFEQGLFLEFRDGVVVSQQRASR